MLITNQQIASKSVIADVIHFWLRIKMYLVASKQFIFDNSHG